MCDGSFAAAASNAQIRSSVQPPECLAFFCVTLRHWQAGSSCQAIHFPLSWLNKIYTRARALYATIYGGGSLSFEHLRRVDEHRHVLVCHGCRCSRPSWHVPWAPGFLQVSERNDVAPAGSFETSSRAMAINNDSIFRAAENRLEVCNTQVGQGEGGWVDCRGGWSGCPCYCRRAWRCTSPGSQGCVLVRCC